MTQANRQGQREKTTSGWATGDRAPEIQRTQVLRVTAGLDTLLSSLLVQRSPWPLIAARPGEHPLPLHFPQAIRMELGFLSTEFWAVSSAAEQLAGQPSGSFLNASQEPLALWESDGH